MTQHFLYPEKTSIVKVQKRLSGEQKINKKKTQKATLILHYYLTKNLLGRIW